MKAYKIWHDEKNYIHKDSTDDLNVMFTTNPDDAKEVGSFREACEFFCDHLGFSLNPSKYDALHFTK